MSTAICESPYRPFGLGRIAIPAKQMHAKKTESVGTRLIFAKPFQNGGSLMESLNDCPRV
jgi:hypothetical protein